MHTAKNYGKNSIFAFSVREDWLKKLNEDAEKIKKYGHDCDELVFLCTSKFTATERDNVTLTEVNSDFGFSLVLYGVERLRMLLNKHSGLIAQHPQIFHPAFFPNQSSLTATAQRDLLVIDNVIANDTLATWLARRLQLEGYQVWSRATSPIAGTSVNETVEKLVKSNAFRLLQIMSIESVSDVEFNARRAYAFGVGDNLVLPLLGNEFDFRKLDSKSSKLETVSFTNSWADGLNAPSRPLADSGCAGFRDAATRLSTTFGVMPDLIKEEPERLISSQFAVQKIPTGINRYDSDIELNDQDIQELALKWAFRKLDKKRFLSFFAPPLDLKRKFGINQIGGAAWELVTEIDKISVRTLIPELIRKSLVVHCIGKGLRYCLEFDGLYFPENPSSK
ncbi:MAG: toll/interleukin-1 receptor domain-containing protein [Candidatus Obscuribacter sp.]|nr:toll/interleukin-1 receptor domain-containing protein [Candidatus Obscuribacter sp.]